MNHTQGHPSTFKKSLIALRAQIHPNTVTVREVNTSLSPIDRSSRQKINKLQSYSTYSIK
jgi:hypothetical protein